jgi:hypothetical protein
MIYLGGCLLATLVFISPIHVFQNQKYEWKVLNMTHFELAVQISASKSKYYC